MSLVNKAVKRKAGLTSRQKAIIELLIKYTAAKPVTIAAVSEKLKLSSRTILREMPAIEKWLNENEFKFIRKPGVGLILAESLENQKLILELLEVEQIEKEYSKEERQRLILGELLAAREPIKSYYYTSKYKISDGTLSNDLDAISLYLAPFSIQIKRKQGLGVYLEGKENDFRQAIANVLYDTLDEKEVFKLISGSKKESVHSSKIEISIQNRLLNLIDLDTIQSIEEILLKTEEKLNVQYSDSAYIGLVVHLSLAIKRIQNNENIVMDVTALAELKALPEFLIAKKIGNRLEEVFQIQIPEDETGYITMHLKGAKLRLNQIGDINTADINIRQIANHIISNMEQELDVEFKNNNTLVEDLSNHLMPAISRLSMNLNIKNSQLDVIKENYTTVFQAAKKACHILNEITGVYEVPESEIAYIAMHFCAALEISRTDNNKLSVVIVCPTGIGTSKLLSANIAKEFHELEIISTISALNIDLDTLKEQEIDFIISTIELSVDYKCLCVNPFLLPQDKLLIKDTIELQKNKRKKPKNKKEIKQKHHFGKEEIAEISVLGEEIISILENIKLYKPQKISGLTQLFCEAGKVFAEAVEQADSIANAFIKRERIANTYIDEYKMFLLHCKSPAVCHCKFGVLRLDKPFLQHQKEVFGAIIMIVPENSSTVYARTMSEISGALIENTVLLQAIIKGGKNEIYAEIENILCCFYAQTIKKRLEMLNYG